MLVTRNDKVIDAVTYTSAATVNFSMDLIDQGSVQIVATDVTPGVKTFTDTDVVVLADTVTIADHGYLTGLKVVTTTSGAAPAGLAAGTWYIVKIDKDTIKFADSLVKALAGNTADITTAGGVGDTQTITPAVLGTCAVDLYASNDGTNFVTLSVGSGNFTANKVALLPILDKFYKYLQLVMTVPAGAVKITATVYGKQYKY
jgi:hypothetical protein